MIPFPPGMFGNVDNYLGPGNITSGWLAWYGLRGFSRAVAASGTQKAVNVRRTSDSTALDVLILRSGKLDVATLTAFLASTTGFVTKWYDQSGNGLDAANATQSQQSQILLTGGPGTGNPTVNFVGGSSQGLTTTSPITTSATGSSSFVAVRTGTFTSVNPVIQAGVNTGYWVTANDAYLYGGSALTASAADNSWHAFNGVSNGASSSVDIDGTVTTGNPGGSSINGDVTIGNNRVAAQFLTGGIVECGFNSQTWSSTIQAAMSSNQHGSNGWNF